MTGTRDAAKPAQWRLKIAFWLDVMLLVSLCALQAVSFSGLALHEWLGLAIVGVIFVHMLLSWSWIASQSRRLFAAQSARARINYILNLSLFASVTATIFSGIRISQHAIPALTGASSAVMDWPWDTLHRQFSSAVLILSGFHLAINWEGALAAGQKVLLRVRGGAL
ncbi:MAG TPA: DUF4405 domain-containing protein [Candidatus Angelobacter sp.]